MAWTHPAFCLRRDSQYTDSHDVVWRNKLVGRIRPSSAIRNRSQGDCFIVCTGPSINDIDLARLADRTVFGVNGAIVNLQQHGCSPKYYTITDIDFFRHRFPLIEQVMSSGASCFFSPEGISVVCERRPELMCHQELYLSEVANHRYLQPRLSAAMFDQIALQDDDMLLHSSIRGKTDCVGFSCDLAKGLFCGRTIAFRAVQIAYHLGFRRIFILGMDLGASGGRVRSYDEKGRERPSLLAQDYDESILPSFEIVRDLCANSEFEVYNLSPDSRLPDSVIPKLSFDEAMVRTARSHAA